MIANHEPLLGTEPPRSSTILHTQLRIGSNPRRLATWAKCAEVRAVVICRRYAVARQRLEKFRFKLPRLRMFEPVYQCVLLLISSRCPLAARTCRERPNFLSALRLAASNALAARVDEAPLFIARSLQLDLELRISNLKEGIAPLRPEDITKYAEALRKAGLPE